MHKALVTDGVMELITCPKCDGWGRFNQNVVAHHLEPNVVRPMKFLCEHCGGDGSILVKVGTDCLLQD